MRKKFPAEAARSGPMSLPSFRAESRNLLYPKVSYRVETQRFQAGQETIREKFPVDMKRSGSKPDRKPLAKSFLLG